MGPGQVTKGPGIGLGTVELIDYRIHAFVCDQRDIISGFEIKLGGQRLAAKAANHSQAEDI